MSKPDAIKEEIGFLKIAFTLIVAVDASLLAWVAQHFTTAAVLLIIGASFGVLLLSSGIVWVSRLVYRRLHELEEL